jgi:hypothetical protein
VPNPIAKNFSTFHDYALRYFRGYRKEVYAQTQSSYSLTSRGYVFTEGHMQILLILRCSIYNYESGSKEAKALPFGPCYLTSLANGTAL